MTEPLPEHEKPIQPDTDLTLGHGTYMQDQAEQDWLWATAVTPEGTPHPDAKADHA